MKEINLTLGKTAILDDDDFAILRKWKWQAIKSKQTYYAVRTEYKPSKRTVYMHKEILSRPGFQTDHIDHNGLNNTKANLRLATITQNNRNKSKANGKQFKGVYLSSTIIAGKKYSYWRSKIRYDGNEINLGNFKSEQEAARAYDSAAKKYHGEFASANF